MSEQMKSFWAVLGLFLLILFLVYLIAVLTPKIAKFVDKAVNRLFRNKPAKKDDSIYAVRSIYDIQPDSSAEKSGDDDQNNIKDGEEKNGEE